MKVIEFIKKEFCGLGRIERFVFPAVIIFITCIAIYMKDTPAAVFSAIFGTCATILAGKGKISCYVFGIAANICYSYISYKNGFWANLALNTLYYLPMQFVGIAKWKKHLKKKTQEIYRTKLSVKERFLYACAAIIFSTAVYYVLCYYNGSNPAVDSITTVLSVIACILTVKRCIEQWYAWTCVNILCVFMWAGAYLNGSHCFATILMWSTYFVLGIYFLYCWKKELKTC